MNKEIKEILKQIECYQNDKFCLIMLSQKENNALLDYITNLQQAIKDTKDTADDMLFELQEENERLKEILKWKQNRESELFTIESVLETNKQLYDERNIYKSRCEKAIEYIKSTDNKPPHYYDMKFDLLNILQNGSEDNE